MADAQYVKFLRGTPKAYENLPVKNKDTLYFIKNFVKGSTTEVESYSLYLGDKPALGSQSEVGQLTDFDLSNLQVNDLLIYDADSGKWKNKDFNSFVQMLNIPEVAVFTGAVAATETVEAQAGTSGLVPAPQVGQDGYFLQGNGQWADLKPIVSQGIKEWVGNAPEEFDTLKEIADWINNDTTGAAALANKVNVLSAAVGDLESLTTSNKENLVSSINELKVEIGKIASGGEIDLSSYLTKNDFNTSVGSLENLKTDTKDNIVNSINELADRLVWGEMEE